MVRNCIRSFCYLSILFIGLAIDISLLFFLHFVLFLEGNYCIVFAWKENFHFHFITGGVLLFISFTVLTLFVPDGISIISLSSDDDISCGLSVASLFHCVVFKKIVFVQWLT